MGAVSAAADFQLSDNHPLTKLDPSSMNIDELLGASGGDGDDESQPSAPSSSEHDHEHDEEDPSSSEIKRSVEEVWREIQEGKATSAAAAAAITPQRTLGEMTLEEFLVKFGVAETAGMGSAFPEDLGGAAGGGGDGDGDAGVLSLGPHKRERDDLGYMQGMGMGIGGGTSGSKRLRGFLPKVEDCCMVPGAAQLVSYGDAFAAPLVKGEECYVDKVAERRQRRMIKNRESAARSRARKQAYTAELEAEVALLKEENDKLRKQHAEDAKHKAKMIDILTASKRSKQSAGERAGLRRINSF